MPLFLCHPFHCSSDWMFSVVLLDRWTFSHLHPPIFLLHPAFRSHSMMVPLPCFLVDIMHSRWSVVFVFHHTHGSVVGPNIQLSIILLNYESVQLVLEASLIFVTYDLHLCITQSCFKLLHTTQAKCWLLFRGSRRKGLNINSWQNLSLCYMRSWKPIWI